MLGFSFIELILFVLLLSILPRCYLILRYWDFSTTTPAQYRYENADHFVSLICKFILLTKIMLLPAFVELLDGLSGKIAGAMCAAGVLNANPYGVPLMLLKLSVIGMSILWLMLNKADIENGTFAFIKKRYRCFVVLSVLMLAEFTAEFLFLSQLEMHKVVLCCNAIFGVNANNSVLFDLTIDSMVKGFYLSFLLYLLAYWCRQKVVVFVLTFVFTGFAYYSFILFFSTYVYEIPTHQCPYCIFQADYYYIGYLVWGLLFSGTFAGLAGIACHYLTLQDTLKVQKYAVISHCLFVLLCSYFVGSYYWRNGVFL